MKRNRIITSISIIICLIVFFSIWLMQGCKKEISPISPVVENTINTNNIDEPKNHIKLRFKNMDNQALNDINIQVQSEGSSLNYHAETDTLDFSTMQQGNLKITVSKNGYLPSTIDLSIEPTSDNGFWFFKRTVILSKQTSATSIDHNGGIINNNLGEFSLSIPKDALSKRENITATQIPTLLKAGIIEPLANRLPVKTFRFEPDGLRFKKEVQVEVDISDISELYESEIYLGYYHEDTDEWEMKKGIISPDGNSAAFGINHFSEWSIVAPYRINPKVTTHYCGVNRYPCCTGFSFVLPLYPYIPPELSGLLMPGDTSLFYFYFSYSMPVKHGVKQAVSYHYYESVYSVDKFNSENNDWEDFSSFIVIEPSVAVNASPAPSSADIACTCTCRYYCIFCDKEFPINYSHCLHCDGGCFPPSHKFSLSCNACYDSDIKKCCFSSSTFVPTNYVECLHCDQGCHPSDYNYCFYCNDCFPPSHTHSGGGGS